MFFLVPNHLWLCWIELLHCVVFCCWTLIKGPHCWHMPVNKIWRWTESTPWSGWCCGFNLAGIYSHCSNHKIIIIIIKEYHYSAMQSKNFESTCLILDSIVYTFSRLCWPPITLCTVYVSFLFEKCIYFIYFPCCFFTVSWYGWSCYVCCSFCCCNLIVIRDAKQLSFI